MARGYRKRTNKRAKWRQQKLSVGTVAKIAKKIAKRLDKRTTKYYINNLPFARDGFTWDSITECVPESAYRPIANGAMESQILSQIGGNILAPEMDAPALTQSMTIAVSGIQARLQLQNDNNNSVKCTCAIYYVPNLNAHTDDAVDFLRPDVFMLYKRGSGNLLYDGFAKQIIRNKASGNSTVRDYQIIASKTVIIPPCTYGGLQFEDTTGTGTPPDWDYMRDISQPGRKRVTLTKYFKRERRHNIKGVIPNTQNRPLNDELFQVIVKMF